MAEKQRRDNHNTNITAMGKLVPAVAESPRKMDKISILRLAVAFLRSHYSKLRRLFVFPDWIDALVKPLVSQIG